MLPLLLMFPATARVGKKYGVNLFGEHSNVLASQKKKQRPADISNELNECDALYG